MPNACDPNVNNTPRAVILATTFGRNHIVANFDGELIIKILPNAAKNDPSKTGTRLC
jgi:hypothetical protein